MKRIFLIPIIVLMFAGTSLAAQQTVNDLETMGQARTKINANDTELYGQAGTKWVSGRAYTASNNLVAHGGILYVCYSNHTAGASTEPNVGASWATVWKVHGIDHFVQGHNTIYTQDSEPAACNTGDMWVDTNGTSGQRLYTCESANTWVAQAGGSGDMVYPGAGIPNSTGSAWGTSYTVGTGANNLVQLNASSQLPAVSAALLTNFPTLNQNTTGTAGGLSGTPNITVGTVTASEYLSSAADGNKWAAAINTVAITADATLGRIAWLTDRYWLANGTNWTTRYLLDSSLVDDTAGGTNGSLNPVSSNVHYDHAVATATHGVSGAIVGTSDSQTLINKTINAEGTGNAITIVDKVWFASAGCNNATATSFYDLPTSNPAAAACITGTNTQKGVLDFDAATDESGQVSLSLPSDWSGNIDLKYKWLAAATSGSVVWGVQTSCVADAETDDPSWNTASTVTDAAKGTTLQTNDASMTSITVTGCAAGELLHLRFFRDANNGSDNMTGDARLIGAELTLRRAQ